MFKMTESYLNNNFLLSYLSNKPNVLEFQFIYE